MKLSKTTRNMLLAAALLLAVAGIGAFFSRDTWIPAAESVEPPVFSGELAFEHVEAQVGIGPRITGTAGNAEAAEYIAEELKSLGWAVEYQSFEYMGTPVRNVIARASVGAGPVLILGAHFDTRRYADHDPEAPREPVLGANDAASGVGVLLELARTLDLEQVPNEVWLAFFDAEDNGDLDGWDWIVGSSYMAANLTVQPEAMLLVDMIGDADQQIYQDYNSDPGLSDEIWATAASLGYGDYFIPEPKYAMLDDHTPFARRGIPAVDIIDFDYPYWHTTEDTLDKVSPDSLERVGRTLEVYLENGGPNLEE